MKASSLRQTRRYVRSVASVLLLSAATLGSVELRAQSCASPFVWAPDIVLPGFTGTTCGGPHVADSFCNGLGNPGPNFVVQFVLRPTTTTTQITLIGGQAGFDPVMYLSNSLDGCSSGTCLASGDAGSPMPLGGLPSGTYYLTVAAAEMDSPDSCGSFMLSMNGDFGGGDDFIFADGFD